MYISCYGLLGVHNKNCDAVVAFVGWDTFEVRIPVYAVVDSLEFKTRTLIHGVVLLYIVKGQQAPG